MASDYTYDPRDDRNKCGCLEVYSEDGKVWQCSRPGCGEKVCAECSLRCTFCGESFCPSHVIQRHDLNGIRGDICIVCVRNAEVEETPGNTEAAAA